MTSMKFSMENVHLRLEKGVVRCLNHVHMEPVSLLEYCLHECMGEVISRQQRWVETPAMFFVKVAPLA